MRLIDANEAYYLACMGGQGCWYDDFTKCTAGLHSLKALLDDCKTVEAEPVRHG